MDFLALIFQLILDTSASWIRMFIALEISVLISIVVGIYAAVSPRAEKIILPIVDIPQSRNRKKSPHHPISRIS